MKAKAKEVVDTQVSDNGQVEKVTPEMELESIKKQYEEALKQQQQYANLAQRCLGAIEILERMVDSEDKQSV
tara:strand:+ start:319 stop:534 length:216 start_codon:yes stop_codon:yes gene_type:complete